MKWHSEYKGQIAQMYKLLSRIFKETLKKILRNKENKDLNSKILINKFFDLTGIKKTNILFFFKSWMDVFIKFKIFKN